MKRFQLTTIVIFFLLILSVVLASCGAPTPGPSAPPPSPVPAPQSAPTPTPEPAPTPKPSSKPSRPPLHVGETMVSHAFAFTPIEISYTEVLINGPFKGSTFDAFKPIEGYKFLYLKMVVQNQGVKRAAPPMYGRDARFKVKVDKGYIYQEINKIASLSWVDEKRWIGRADPKQMQEYPCSNHLVFDLNPEEHEELLVVFEIPKDTEPTEISFRLFASPEFASEYGIETIIVPTPTPVLESKPTPTPAPTKGELSVHFIDVGQGGSILIDVGETEVLIDGGNRSPGVVTYLKEYVDAELEVMVATHPHADHIGGLIAVLSAFEVQGIWLNGDTSTSKTYSEFMSRVNAEGATINEARRGQLIEVGNLTFVILHPVSPLVKDTNNNSVVLLLRYGTVDFLFTGDAEKEAEAAMLKAADMPVPDVEILKVGHHGSRSSLTSDFLAITSPEVAVYMAGKGNRYGHPHEETIQALLTAGTQIYGTDVHGTIVITSDGEKYEIQLGKQAPPVTVATEPSPPPQKSEQPTPTPAPEPQKAVNVQIVRIFYDGQVPRVESDEYVEINNLGTEPVDLAGWVLKDISEGYPSFTFPSYVLKPGESIRVYTDEIHPEYGGFSFGYGKAIWNNKDPDTAALYDTQGKEVSRKSY